MISLSSSINDLKCFNRQLNRFLTSPKPTMTKFVTFIQRVVTSMSLKAIEVRKDPLDYSSYKKNTKKVETET